MSGKFCSACGWWVEHSASACPNCKASNFDHRDPETQTNSAVGSTTVLQRKSQSEIEEENRRQFEESIDPDVLVRFKRRFQSELEEITYLQWRAMQPQWKAQVAKAESDPKSDAGVSGFVTTQPYTTAAGVFIGTSMIRNQLDEVNDNLADESTEISGGDEEGGFLDSLGDFF
jgi:hypothetical protein